MSTRWWTRVVGLPFVAIAILLQARPGIAQTLSPSYAVVIGITKYERPLLWGQLDTAVPDAGAVQRLLEAQGFSVTPLLDRQATRSAIIKTLRELAKKLDANGSTSARVVVYFAGHGWTESVGGTDYGYLIPWDATSDSASYVSMDDLRDISARLSTARHQLYLLDSCFGGLLITREPIGLNRHEPGYVRAAMERKAVEVLTAGGKNQTVVSNGPHGHSPFTGALLEALGQGLADMRQDGFITFGELVNYVIARASNRYQTPGYGTLPGHGLGEFVFRSPKPSTPNAAPAPALTASPTLRSGVELLGAEPVSLIAKEYWSNCRNGNVTACFQLGASYDFGKYGLQRNEVRASTLYQLACDSGEPTACFNLGFNYEHGLGGLAKDEAQASALFTRACNDLEFDACVSKGEYFLTGRGGLTRNKERAFELFKRACDGGSTRGCASRANAYLTGDGIIKDEVEGVALLNRLCAALNYHACNYLGMAYWQGLGRLRKDGWFANVLYRESCDHASWLACYNLAFNYEHGLGDLRQDKTVAIDLYNQACEGGVDDGCAAARRLSAHP